MQRASEGSPFLFLWMREKDAEIAEIVAGGSGEEGVAEVGEEGKGVATSEEVLRREFEGVSEGPIVGCVIATGDEAVGFSGVMGGVKKIVRGEKEREAGICEGGMIALGSFGEIRCGEPIADSWREFFIEMVGVDNASDIG